MPDAKAKITAWLEERGVGKGTVNFKLRDWLFSRQRYWGEPFPLIHAEDGEVLLVDEADLPVTLPQVERYEPSGTGESPRSTIEDWGNVTLPDGRKGKRETNTMPQWAGSCWYYLRYIDPQNTERPWDPEKERYWMPVDLYVGGAEHAYAIVQRVQVGLELDQRLEVQLDLDDEPAALARRGVKQAWS